MALTMINYVSGKTVITAENLNEIQDAVLDVERKGGLGMGICGSGWPEGCVDGWGTGADGVDGS